MNPRIGDICEASGRTGLWTITSISESSRGHPADCKGIQTHAGVYFSRTGHPASFTVKFRPQLEVGERYRWGGRNVEIEAINGDVVAIRGESHSKLLKGGGQIRHAINRSYINRGFFIAENLDSILKERRRDEAANRAVPNRVLDEGKTK